MWSVGVAWKGTYLCLDHVVPVLTYRPDVTVWVQHSLVLRPLHLRIYGNESASTTHTSTVNTTERERERVMNIIITHARCVYIPAVYYHWSGVCVLVTASHYSHELQ